MKKITTFLLFLTGLLSLIIALVIPGSIVQAQPAPCVSSTLNEGLISGLGYLPGSANLGNTAQTCVLDPQATYRDFKIPSYADLENQFYSLSRTTAKRTDPLPNGNLDNIIGDGIYLQPNSMNINTFTGSGVKVIFVRQNLYINGNINYADTDPYSGLVFVVGGNIYINTLVTKVNAVLISSGTICTAFSSTLNICLNQDSYAKPPDNIPYPSQLTINGSLISLNKTNLPQGISAINLGRNLQNNENTPAEIIKKQPKFLYLLRNGIFTKDLVLTEEDKNYTITDPGVPLPPAPPPDPVCPGATDPLGIPAIPAGQAWKAVSDCVLSIFDSAP